ncbi:hypothetical protein Glove_501g6 [Diversispora epigaea]|uniref:Serine-threonine/tyrosine-protein kinase catalytic domain-containing protein n=1 Tax=Diversispora epigaea TaxID=1348612 RepID=A0A397GMR7_9GLOM|nr:hypothetical protein Glove_501g6 [Diversispora epigaea]
MRCWDARVTHRPTFKELYDELYKYSRDYRKNESKNNNEITIQIVNSEKLSKNLGLTNSTTSTPMNYKTHPEAIYTSRLLNYSSLPKPKNDEDFENELEELTESTSALSIGLTNSTTSTPMNYKTHPEAIYTSRLLNYSSLPKPKNDEDFENELEELTESTSALSIAASKLQVLNF